ncbi:MAG: acyl-CoA synthetase [Haloarculaceae archaeon]
MPDTWTVMPAYDTYEAAREQFEWDLPESYNPGHDFLRKHDADATALRFLTAEGEEETYTFGDLDAASDELAGGLESLGVEPGDRVGVMVPQRPETLLTHLACWKLGAVTIPLTTLFGPDALSYRLADAGARALVAHPSVRETYEEAREECPDLEHVVEVGDAVGADAHAFADVRDRGEPGYDCYDSTPDTDSAIMYTSGSTGPPKGVRHSHALWLGRAAASFNFFDRNLGPGATCWTPADWAWGGALGGLVFGALHHGATVVGHDMGRFDEAAAFDLLERFEVTEAFVPPTALRMLMQVDDPAERWDLSLRTVAAAGEPLTPEIVEWADAELGVPVNEFYGQTELNLVAATSSWFETRPGSMGKALPGYDIAVLDPDTREELGTGAVGEIAVRPGDESVFFTEYWNMPEKTRQKKQDGWYLTDDLAEIDEDGYIWFKSRADDVILTSGYRVGPTEVERAVLEHDDVEQVGVVGVPDETRGEIVKAFVKPAEGVAGSEKLRTEIQDMVKNDLAKYEYPREIAFVDELPQTSTGKIRRKDLRE